MKNTSGNWKDFLNRIQMRNSSYNKSVVRQNYIATSQKDRQEIAEAVKKTEKGDGI